MSRALPSMIWHPAKKAFGMRCWRASRAPTSGFRASSFMTRAARLCSRKSAVCPNIIRPVSRSRSSKRIRAISRPAAYVPVDISREHLRDAAISLAEDFPSVPVIAVCADYTRPFPLPSLPGTGGKRVGFFPGSTIGNFEPDAAVAFLANYAHILGRGGEMLIGVDLKKETEILEAAYNDRAGVTAAFNLNLLKRE